MQPGDGRIADWAAVVDADTDLTGVIVTRIVAAKSAREMARWETRTACALPPARAFVIARGYLSRERRRGVVVTELLARL